MAQVAVCSQINTKHINTVWAERTVLNVKLLVHHVTGRLLKVNTFFIPDSAVIFYNLNVFQLKLQWEFWYLMRTKFNIVIIYLFKIN